jgi:hypothetical protein
VLANIAEDAGLAGLIQRDSGSGAIGKNASTWVVLSRDAGRLSSLAADARWQGLQERRTGQRAWTDDFSNVLGALS